MQLKQLGFSFPRQLLQPRDPYTGKGALGRLADTVRKVRRRAGVRSHGALP